MLSKAFNKIYDKVNKSINKVNRLTGIDRTSILNFDSLLTISIDLTTVNNMLTIINSTTINQISSTHRSVLFQRRLSVFKSILLQARQIRHPRINSSNQILHLKTKDFQDETIETIKAIMIDVHNNSIAIKLLLIRRIMMIRLLIIRSILARIKMRFIRSTMTHRMSIKASRLNKASSITTRNLYTKKSLLTSSKFILSAVTIMHSSHSR